MIYPGEKGAYAPFAPPGYALGQIYVYYVFCSLNASLVLASLLQRVALYSSSFEV